MEKIDPTKTLTLPYYKLTFCERIVALFKARDKHVAEMIAEAYIMYQIAAANKVDKRNLIEEEDFNLKHCTE